MWILTPSLELELLNFRIDHSAKLEAALKELGCVVKVERAGQAAGRVR